ncbi:MAG: hypothetical protein ABGW97_09805 [Christiangramia sp.]|uniref:hypothetical protein n=1 Tax=Christiangramia sp. TaxID=1931228 RepID=UPI003242E961
MERKKYQYNFEDWLNGNINWMSIEVNQISNSYIKQEDIKLIREKQKEIFNEEFSKVFEKKKSDFVNSIKGVPNREYEINRHLKTFENLLLGDIEAFKDEEVSEVSNGDYQNPIFYSVKVVPPLDLTYFDKNDLENIQNAYKYLQDNGDWNYESVEVSDRKKLYKHVEFKGHLWAKVGYELLKYMSRFKDSPFNGYLIEMDKMEGLDKLRAGLKRKDYLSKKVKKSEFIKLFNGKYILQDQKVNWLSNYNSLRYLLTGILNKRATSKNYGFYETAANCFLIRHGCINPETLRKATEEKISSTERADLDRMIEEFNN